DGRAHGFVHAAGWTHKRLPRLIHPSSTYHMARAERPPGNGDWHAVAATKRPDSPPASLPDPISGRPPIVDYAHEDPENERLWRFPYHRLEVEAIRDSMLAVSGQLNRKMSGPGVYLSVPKEALEGHSDPDKIWQPLDEREDSRRAVYAFIKRSLVVPMLEVLDLCDTTRSSAGRLTTTVPTQALTLLNSEFVNRQSRHFAVRLTHEAGDDPRTQIDRAYRLTLCRPPTPEESAALTTFLAQEAAALERESSLEPPAARREALVRLCRVIFNLNEFVYPD
ncbi:MAG: DUF1553 domain-containing protein, partial [Planctomycetes bacterium]|nr:DUF1553 domain-containing protein [Planctomycetota bacterium]